ncbi:alpha/beta hydrolase [Promethearchaeum syntrophicum]|uniref:Alpha/beta hydrolase n=1 Tax=Promethearchaeum syntrophicum TaxID=2594042 RepID=A0A5B9DBW9_9ARCH|nr:alpha/beta fold hydrolase [Candidatus Prometheoarchaeum syntrophicum]QEE16531.1 Alpha/beta hydrolase family protein [Candidatus Prometheoarchaeum syntrophicum]
MKNRFWMSAFDGKIGNNQETLLQYSNSFWLKNEKNRIENNSVVICLHGWTATTFESKPVGDAIFQSGIDSAGPLLPGHGFKDNQIAKKILSEIKYTDWISAVRHEINKAKKIYKKVFIYGQSMGGALALNAASEGCVDGCAVTAPAIKLPILVNFLSPLIGFMNIFRKKERNQKFFNEEYPFESFKSANELRKLAKNVQKNLSKIKCPILVCHSKNDTGINPIVTEIIKENVKGPIEIAWFNDSGHSMTLDVQGNEITKKISTFFMNLTKN